MALTQSSLASAQRIAATLVERSHPGRRSAWRACAITLVVVAAALSGPASASAAIRAKLVRDIAPGKSNSLPSEFNNFGGELFFTANDHVHGWEPLISDGTW